MSLFICPDCNVSVCDSTHSCGCDEGKYRVTFEFKSGSIRRRFFKSRNEAESAVINFEDSNDPRRVGCIVEVQDNSGKWCPHDGDAPY